MLDWPGLLKWTIAQSDGTTFDKDVKPMSEEDKKFLQAALESVSVDEAKRMREIVDDITQPETKGDKKQEEIRVNMIEDLSDLVEGLENARDLVRMNIYGKIVDLMFNSVHPEVRKALYFLFASCNSNNSYVQEASMKTGGFQLINSIIREEDLVTKEAAFAALSSLVRGEYLASKRRFIDIEGIEFILELLKNDDKYNSNKIRTKVVTLLNDLVFYDDKLDYATIAQFNKSGNTGSVKVNDKTSQHISIKKDEEQKAQEKQEEQKPAEDLSKYKNIVKGKLIEKGFLQLCLKYLNKDILKPLSDLRSVYFSLAATLIQYDPKCKPSQDYFNKLSDFALALDEANKSQDNFYESELGALNNLIQLE